MKSNEKNYSLPSRSPPMNNLHGTYACVVPREGKYSDKMRDEQIYEKIRTNKHKQKKQHLRPESACVESLNIIEKKVYDRKTDKCIRTILFYSIDSATNYKEKLASIQ